MANPNFLDPQFDPQSYRDTRDLAQLWSLAIRDNADTPVRSANARTTSAPAVLFAQVFPQEGGRLRASSFRADGREMPHTLVDPNFRQLSTVSPLRSRDTDAGKNSLPPTSSVNIFGSNEGRQSDMALSEDRATNARLAPVEAGFGQLVRPLPFPPIGPAGQLPKPQLPDWWPTLEDILRIYPMVRYGRVRRGDDDEDCVERHSKEVDRCFQRYNQGEYAHPDFLSACKERASNRRNLCVANGGKPRADEPKEWSLKDEEVYRNLDR